MKKKSSHAHRPSAAAAVVTTQAYVRLLFTGICRLICDNPHTPLVVLMPDGREARASSTDPSLVIPSHHAFVMYAQSAVDTTQPHRDPDLLVASGANAVCLLEEEMLSLAGGTIVGIPPTGSTTGVVDMGKVCTHAKPDPMYATFPPAAGVLAQVQVPYNQFCAHALSTHSVTFSPLCTGVTTPFSGQVAEVVRVDLEIDDASTLMLISHPFGGGPAEAPIVLSLSGTTSTAPLEITFGNTPLPDLLRWQGDLPAGPPHGDRDVHFELYYMLAPNVQQAVPIPIMSSMLLGQSNCPPTCC
jgi:hypothetical protein